MSRDFALLFICGDSLASVLGQALCQLGEQQGMGKCKGYVLREQELQEFARTPGRDTTGGSPWSWREALYLLAKPGLIPADSASEG